MKILIVVIWELKFQECSTFYIKYFWDCYKHINFIIINNDKEVECKGVDDTNCNVKNNVQVSLVKTPRCLSSGTIGIWGQVIICWVVDAVL